MRSFNLAASFALLAGMAAAGDAQATFVGGALRFTVDARGDVGELRSTVTGRDYRHPGAPAPLVTLVSGGERLAPARMTRVSRGTRQVLRLSYPTVGAHIDVEARIRRGYLTFRIVEATPAAKIDAIIWGPYPTTIGHTVGEIIGVVRDTQVALGLQVLNLKTLGGALPNSEGSTWERGIAAKPMPWGSQLNAYAINRDRERRVDAWGGNYPNMPVPQLPGETVVGSAIAFFSCPEPATLDLLERIALAEGLPHQKLRGVWFQKSPLYGRSYLISSFGETEVDEMIGYTKRAGLFSLYHEGPFLTWGHFALDPAQWPGERRAMQGAVAKARVAGLHFGVHTLTNFLTTNDPYVTPVPDDRLSLTGSSTLVRAADARQTEIEVASPEYFANDKHDNLRTVKIGKELVRCTAVTTAPPYVLQGCERGAFGTVASPHAAGTSVGKLFDHPYKVFFPNFELQREVARQLADFLNETGVDHIDFDGYEGALASGQGDYALGVFANDVVSRVKHDLINGTSISKTFYWHIGSYYNWGEPWYGGFAESMQQYRIDNQALFDRNYMPHMLGWYLLTDSTTMDEMEWMLARAAGYDAGFAMVARPKALRANPRAGALLDAIREWETARVARAFNPAQAQRLKDPKRAFHLERLETGVWRLHEAASTVQASPVVETIRARRQ
ncbi:MAG: hypothetical protein FJ363_04170 [Gemmatimonadetes bacterium]|nr:hypothetical protein [Gemmatimonadota bacterium]